MLFGHVKFWDGVAGTEQGLSCSIWKGKDVGGFNVIFDNCCHGGQRKKSSRWWSFKDWFSSLQAECDGNHFHPSWAPRKEGGKLIYPSAEEAAYPILLCERLATILVDQMVKMGATIITTLSEQQHSQSLHRFLIGLLPRGKMQTVGLNVFPLHSGSACYG